MELMNEPEPRVVGEPRCSAFRPLPLAQERRNLGVVRAGVEHSDNSGSDLLQIE